MRMKEKSVSKLLTFVNVHTGKSDFTLSAGPGVGGGGVVVLWMTGGGGGGWWWGFSWWAEHEDKVEQANCSTF